MKILVTILICSYSISCLNAQEKLRYKEVSAQEFNAVPVPDDKDADALVLFDVGSMRFAEPFSFSAP